MKNNTDSRENDMQDWKEMFQLAIQEMEVDKIKDSGDLQPAQRIWKELYSQVPSARYMSEFCTKEFAANIRSNLWKVEEFLEQLKTDSTLDHQQRHLLAAAAIHSLVYAQKAFSIEQQVEQYEYYKRKSGQLTEKAFEEAVTIINRSALKFEALLLRQRSVVPDYDEILCHIFEELAKDIKKFDFGAFSPHLATINQILMDLNTRILKYS